MNKIEKLEVIMLECKSYRDLEEIENLQKTLTKYMMCYKFGMEEINTKISILQQEFQFVNSYNPIEHVKSRLKTPQSIINKIHRRGFDFTIESIKKNVLDIAGIRIICSFTSDIYSVAKMLMDQRDIEVVEYKDYIEKPKPNGYQSLHMILKIPVFMSDRVEEAFVEVQIRTMAMEFWASLEHKIYYKYDKEIPENLRSDLKDAADQISQLDYKMEHIHKQMQKLKFENDNKEKVDNLINEDEFSKLKNKYINMLFNNPME